MLPKDCFEIAILAIKGREVMIKIVIAGIIYWRGGISKVFLEDCSCL